MSLMITMVPLVAVSLAALEIVIKVYVTVNAPKRGFIFVKNNKIAIKNTIYNPFLLYNTDMIVLIGAGTQVFLCNI